MKRVLPHTEPPATRRRESGGFTLIELLVVVAIIVALLAILLPSMGRAIYAAQLTACGSNLNQVGIGMLSYAADNHAAYPSAPQRQQPAELVIGGGVDLRPMLGRYIDFNGIANCPLSGKVDYYTDGAAQDMWMDYNFYAGFRYAGGQPMGRVGQRFSVNGARFGVLAADRDLVMPGRPELQSSHPDRDGVTQLVVRQDAEDLWGARTITISIWSSFGTADRGTIDQNFLHDDQSVRPIHGVEADDERLTKVPIWSDTSEFPGAYSQLPSIGY